MRRCHVPTLLVLMVLASPAAPSALPAADVLVLPEGFSAKVLDELDPTLEPPQRRLGALGYSPAGEPVVYENGEIRLSSSSGADTLAVFDPPVYGSFLVPAPDGNALIFGESSAGNVYSVALDGSGETLIGNLPFNYDLAIAPPDAPESIRGQAFVSAPGAVGNSVYLIDLSGSTSPDEVVTAMPGFSGPLTFDDEGNLYYITSTLDPTQSLVRFTPAELASGVGAGATDFAEGDTLLADLEGAYGLRHIEGQLFLTNLGFSSGIGAIERVDLTDGASRTTWATLPLGDSTARPQSIALHPGSDPFEPGVGRSGGKMLIAYGDFATLSHVAEVTPSLDVPDGGFLALPEGFDAALLLELDPAAPAADQLGGLAYSPSGEPIVYEAGEVRILRESGPEVIASFEPSVFGSFLVTVPAGDAVLFGESSTGDIHSVALDGSGKTMLGNLPFNFDLAFAPPDAPEAIRGKAFVSAPGEFGNSIYLFDPDAAVVADEVVANAPGFSGPLTFDDAGNLYYVTSTFDPVQTLARFTPEQLASGIGETAVEFAAGEVLLDDLEGAYGLRHDAGDLLLTHLGFGSGTGAIEVVDLDEGAERSVFATVPIREGTGRPTLIAVDSADEPFLDRRGEYGGRLLVAYSDYTNVTHVVEVTSQLYFLRGDVNSDSRVDISDAIFLLEHQFRGGATPRFAEPTDTNADDHTDLSDAIYLLNFLFRGGPVVPLPYPELGPAP